MAAQPVALDLFLREWKIWDEEAFFPVEPERILVGRTEKTPAIAFAVGYERDLIPGTPVFKSPRISLLAVLRSDDSEIHPPLFELRQPLGYKKPWWESSSYKGEGDWRAVFWLEHMAEIEEWMTAAKELL